MDTLNYEVLAKSGYNGYILKNAPEKVLQFGEGNFLRAFVDYWFDLANEKADWNGKCVLVQPIAPGLAKMINEQEGLYTLYLRGSENGRKVDDKRVISSLSRCLNPYEEEGFKQMMDVAASDDLEIIVSNTTEAGIVYDPACKLEDVPASSFPGKLTQVLYHRYKAGKKGIIMLACELIDNNGKELLKCVNQYIDQWGLDDGFRKYVNEDCTFCGSLVDRIVPGRIRDPKEVAELEQKHGYADPLLDVGEVFGVWVIEGDTKLNDVLPFRKAGLESRVFVTPDMSPYKKRKVRILNGAHTGFVLGAYLAGFDIVRDCMHDATVLGYMNKMLLDEVVPILPLDQEDCKKFAAAVQDRFNNPFVNHELMSISLNSTSKWRARNMPSFLEYVGKNGKLPTCLTMSFAAYIAFYSNDVQELTDKGLVCKRAKGNEYTVSDDRWVLEFYNEHKNDDVPTLVHAVMTNEQMWGQDLTKVPGFEEATVKNLTNIRENGAHTGFVLGAYLAGFDIVRDCMHNDTVRGFMNKMLHEEIIPTLPLDKKDLEDFASAVEDRFNNPFVNHELMSISLNSTSKWRARNMPSFLAYIEEQKQLPKCLTMSLAAYIAFYSNDIQERTADGLICKRPAGNTYKIQDDAWALDFYYAHKDDTAAQLVHAVLTNTQMWDQDLTKIEGLEAAVLADLEMIRTQGAEAAYKSCL